MVRVHVRLLGVVGLAPDEEHGLDADAPQEQLVAQRARRLEALAPLPCPVAQLRELRRRFRIGRIRQDLLDASEDRREALDVGEQRQPEAPPRALYAQDQ